MRPDAVAQALVEVDPTLELLQKCIENGFSHYVDEQAATVHMLVQQALSFTGDETQIESNGDQSHEVARLAETQMQTSWDDSRPSWVPEQVKQALVAALNRLGCAAASAITPVLKASFGQTEILALIQFLRQQLFQEAIRNLSERWHSSKPKTKTLSASRQWSGSCHVVSIALARSA